MSAFQSSRRSFLRGSAVGGAALLGLGDLGALSGLRPVSAAEVQGAAGPVPLRPEIAPIVEFIEKTPREELIEKMAARIRKGLSYREVLAALLLAGVRNVQPRPYVGFKFHAVLVVNSTHLASLSAPDSDRWLPTFWALDYLKGAQARDVAEGDWTMAKLDDGKLPASHRARKELVAALDSWDEEAADRAVASLARSASIGSIYELLWRYGSRDFRSIGHKAIYVSSSFRTLQTIGLEHAEPVLRSLVYALLQRGEENPATSDQEADRPYRRNVPLAASLKESWLSGKSDDGATNELRRVCRDGSADDAARKTVELLGKGLSVQSVWDAIFVTASELVLRQPRILPLHAVTTVNGIHFAFHSTTDDATRRVLLLQAASFLPMFRDSARGRGQLPGKRIDDLAEGAKALEGKAAIESIFANARRDNDAASRELLAFLDAGGDARKVVDAARVLVFLKGRDAHDYKFSSAVLEDYYHVSPRWRGRFLAGNVGLLHGSTERDNGLVQRIRTAFTV